ncbi:hypothetical protein GTA08_BOTSDO13653 [Neofusicoccum parvum]|nr:hypothetical protein GTA08_BOTSDO13653 [Neofusicoccum parvum]
MLDGIPPERIEHASQIFQIVRAAKSPIDLLSLSFADEDDDTLAYDHPIEPPTPDQEAARCDQMQRRLATHCNGLLTTSPSATTPIPTVHHLHPTIRAYLHRPTTWTRLTTPTPPHLALAHASLLRLRTARLTPTQHHTHTLTNPPPASLAALLLAAIAALTALDAAAAALHADLWDALAATTQTLVARAGLCAAPGCWCRGPADAGDGPLLAVAVRARAVGYVAYRLGRTWVRVRAERVESGAAGVLGFAVAAGVGEGGDEEEGRARVVAMLLEWGADPNFRGGVARSPWEEVVEGGGVEEFGAEVWEEMLRYGADRKVVGLTGGMLDSSGMREKRKRTWMKRVWRREDGRMRWKRKV